MIRTFKYRLFPSHAQQRQLNRQLEESRWLWNHFLADRKDAWETQQQHRSYCEQAAQLPALKRSRESLLELYSQSAQAVLKRLDLAFQAFFRRLKSGETPGYPRFKAKARGGSLHFPQLNEKWIGGERVRLPKVGRVRFKQHRLLQGQIKTMTVRRSASGKWYVSFACEVPEQKLPKLNRSVAIDLGVSKFATLSNGEVIENPAFFVKEERELARAQRKENKKAVTRIHERVAWRRENFAHQQSHRLLTKFDQIAVEELAVQQMQQSVPRPLAKRIADAAWKQFTTFLRNKAESAGYEVTLVDPAFTSQTCSACGARVKMRLKDRIFACSCGLQRDRDENAALNIFQRAFFKESPPGWGLPAGEVRLPRSPGLQAGE